MNAAPATTASVLLMQLTHMAPTLVRADELGEALVADAVRLVGGRSELLVAPRLVLCEVALEPPNLAVALERQHVGGDAVEEPAVVADDDGAAGEALEPGLERPQRVDVEVVRRLVEQQHVAAALEKLGQVHPVALAARQVADALLLVGALEVEAGDVGPSVHLAVADLELVDASGDLLVHGGVAVEAVATLVDVAELHGVADRDRARVRSLGARQHLEQGRL